MSVPPAGTLAGEALRAALVTAGALAMLVATELFYRRARPAAETTRKMVHVGGGLVAMAFPWIFDWTLSVVALGLAMGAVIAIGGRLGLLQSVTGVERRSLGQVYHPIAIVVLFLLAHRQPVFYVVSLWTLVMADAAAALLGKRYGRLTYVVHDERKSLEGSAAFFLVAFLGIHVPLLLWTPMPREASVVVSLQLALLVTCFEAIGMRGNDNLIVPLGAYYLLIKLTPAPAAGIVLQLAAQLALLGIALVLAWRTRFLSWAGAVAAHLTLYASFSLGGPAWTVAPAMVLTAYALLERRASRGAPPPEGRHQVLGVFYVSIVAVIVLAADNTFATLVEPGHPLGVGHPFYVPFVAALAAHLAIAVLRVWRGWRSRPAPDAAAAVSDAHAAADTTDAALAGIRPGPLALHAVLAAAMGFVSIVPVSFAFVPAARTPQAFGLAGAICLAATVLYATARSRIDWFSGATWDLRGQALAVACAVAALLPVVLARAGLP